MPFPPTSVYDPAMSRPLRIEFPGAVYHVTSRGDRCGYGVRSCLSAHGVHYPPAMSRPLRIEFPGAIYHVTSRGDRREPIYRDDEDRSAQIEILARAMTGSTRSAGLVLAYCQIGNHYHLVLHTRQANLSRLMRHVNGVYTQTFNRSHDLAGHLLQGRFKAILVDPDASVAVCRYVERNPVAAGIVAPAAMAVVELPKAQRKSAGTLGDCLKRCADRAQALRMAYRECGISMSALAKQLDLSVSHISRLIAAAERGGDGKGQPRCPDPVVRSK